jgi:hypothetical protein
VGANLGHIESEVAEAGENLLAPIRTRVAYAIFVKSITLSADEHLIEAARNKARAQNTTLNAAFRAWLLEFTGQTESGKEYDALMQRLRYVKAGRHFSRDEMNERGNSLPLRHPIQ